MKDKGLSLKALINNMHAESDFSKTFYKKSTKEFITIDDDIRRWVDDSLAVKDAPEWMQESIQEAKEIEEGFSEDYYALPDRYEINQKRIMQGFTQGMSDYDQAMELVDAIASRDPFRRFKQLASDFGVIYEWYAFMEHKYKDIAIRWCDQHHLPYIDDVV